MKIALLALLSCIALCGAGPTIQGNQLVLDSATDAEVLVTAHGVIRADRFEGPIVTGVDAGAAGALPLNHLEVDGGVSILGPVTVSTGKTTLGGATESKAGIALNGPGDAGWAGGYLRIPCPVNDAGAGWVPPAADCNTGALHQGRICIGGRSGTNGTLWICTGLGWEEIIAPP